MIDIQTVGTTTKLNKIFLKKLKTVKEGKNNTADTNNARTDKNKED